MLEKIIIVGQNIDRLYVGCMIKSINPQTLECDMIDGESKRYAAIHNQQGNRNGLYDCTERQFI